MNTNISCFYYNISSLRTLFSRTLSNANYQKLRRQMIYHFADGIITVVQIVANYYIAMQSWNAATESLRFNEHSDHDDVSRSRVNEAIK